MWTGWSARCAHRGQFHHQGGGPIGGPAGRKGSSPRPSAAEPTRNKSGPCPSDLPGPLGELAYRELIAYAEFGYRFSDDGLISRLAAAVLATRSDHHPEAEQEP